MSHSVALDVCREALLTTLLLSLPILSVALLVALVIGLFQAATQLQEQTIASIPKMIAVGAVVLFLAPWLFQHLVDYAVQLYQAVPDRISSS